MAITPGKLINFPMQCSQCGMLLVSEPTIHSIVSGFINGLNKALNLKKGQFEMRLVFKASASRASGGD
jgi:hypothetical protein